MAGEFVDSNVLLYLTSKERPDKAERAEAILRKRPVVSVQVLNEVANVTRKKFGREWHEIRAFLDALAPLLDVHALTEAMHRDALRLAERHKLQWFDSLLIAAALALHCDAFLSEDMHAGLVIDGRLTIVNPFA